MKIIICIAVVAIAFALGWNAKTLHVLHAIDRVLDMLERHLPKQLLHLVDKARELLPDHQTYSQEKPHERGHSWGDMSL